MKIPVLLLMFLSAFFNYSISQNSKITPVESAKVSDISQQTKTTVQPLIVAKCNDFAISGKGDNLEWNKATWNNLAKLDTGGKNFQSRFKMLYSTTGIYVLFSGDDEKITTKDYKDFEAIFNGDVFEVFFHPDAAVPVYFEYEINQMNRQLILSISKINNQMSAWAPTNYNDKNSTAIKRSVFVDGEKTEVNAQIKSWSAEVFFPFELLGLLPDLPPKSGAVWNANFCRLDYDNGNMIKYSWSPTIQTSFHELEHFRQIKFQ